MNDHPSRFLRRLGSHLRPARRFWGATRFYFYNHLITHVPLYFLRHWYLRCFLGYRIGAGAAVHMGCFFTGWDLTVGDSSIINRRCYIDGRQGVIIGSNVSISPECYIVSNSHDVQSAHFSGKGGTVVIDEYAWLGARAIVLPAKHIGRGAVVGAGAVVVRDVAPFEIVGGNPAEVISRRNPSLCYTLAWKPYFDTDID